MASGLTVDVCEMGADCEAQIEQASGALVEVLDQHQVLNSLVPLRIDQPAAVRCDVRVEPYGLVRGSDRGGAAVGEIQEPQWGPAGGTGRKVIDSIVWSKYSNALRD